MIETKQRGSDSHGKSWKKLSWKVMENLFKIGSREILLRAERIIFRVISNASSSDLANTIVFF